MADGDAELTTFSDWIDELNRIARERGMGDGSITEQTGEQCWFGYYGDGLTPGEALEEDASYNPG